ncbi:tRNA (adenosine(37)-N6)-threonylcarbamoyltransferase complex transferase subunit TsaD [Candidatus Dependentiae bacterium]|nr:tRNA (adenosine(37)-N6)-threonylcarbamoyltransferase complex transferase subunit TsaD [Candidatus Dependentiae bacterium]
MFILGIETSCDETGVAVFDVQRQFILSNVLYSQIALHEAYGGVVPEIASRSQLEKIEPLVTLALEQAGITLEHINTIAVTNKPGLVGSLLVGVCYAKGLAWAAGKKIIGINHLEGHIFSTFLKSDNSVATDIPFPHISLTVSGGHTAIYLVEGLGQYTCIGSTQDDAAGEAFDKVAKMMGFPYPGGARIEKMAAHVGFEDFFKYPRTKNAQGEIFFSFSGIKTAVLYHLVREGAYSMEIGPVPETDGAFKDKVASSLLVCITDIFIKNIELAFKKYPAIKGFTFGGGVACNKYMQRRMAEFCTTRGVSFHFPPPAFCTDNGGMIAFVGGYKAQQGKFDDFTIDAGK